MKYRSTILCVVLLGCAGTDREDALKTKQRIQTPCCEQATCSCDSTQTKEAPARQVQIEFLYLDLTHCDRCQGTERRLQEALEAVRKVLADAGFETVLRETQVTSERQAMDLAFMTSPTVRVMGRDIQLDFKETACDACGDLTDCKVDCRVWKWRGREYTVPPREMLVDAVLRAVYAPPSDRTSPKPIKELPENLRRYFRGRK